MSLISRHNILEILTNKEVLELQSIIDSDTKRKFETGTSVVFVFESALDVYFFRGFIIKKLPCKMYEVAVNSVGVPVELANVAILVPGYTGQSEIGYRFIIKKRNLLVGNYEITNFPIIKGESI